MDQPENTKARLLDAAERAFAEKGIASASLREITATAGANLAAVNYHFGSKDGLLRAVFARMVDPINEERLARLSDAERASGEEPIPVKQLLRIFLEPVMRHFTPDCCHLPQLIARLHQETNESTAAMMAEVLGPVVERFAESLQRTLPHLDASHVLLRGNFMIGAMLQTLSSGRVILNAFSRGAVDTGDQERLLSELVDFCAAGFEHA